MNVLEVTKPQRNENEIEIKIGEKLVHPDGRTVTFMKCETNEKGDFLIVEHRMTQRGALNGPHWHPELTESFSVKEGRMRFLVDKKEIILEPGEEITVYPNQVHQFWNISEQDMVVTHVIRPPGRHWKMFALVHKLECEGKMSAKGVPRNLLWLGVAWECIDGYIVGPPKFIQKVFLGGLAKLAKWLGYRI
ncbi:cupin domain-containing protein [Paenibacillus favisporus]|uniref:cupin domain-containing protein n=1 Tax=Paenibacillus favisporus TaxID=221028 RepID=UPI002DB966BC|nr:cupin domain-containing protein [Paenibacillus favisporus]MEC0174583.1 cupin domain-containing protein [Paenibacillus favisporus]